MAGWIGRTAVAVGRFLALLPRRVAMLIVRIYQKTLSPDHGPTRRLHPYGVCRYRPTCSEYAHEAFRRFGLIHGLGLTIWRVCRCNPWSRGGYDPVPDIQK